MTRRQRALVTVIAAACAVACIEAGLHSRSPSILVILGTLAAVLVVGLAVLHGLEYRELCRIARARRDRPAPTRDELRLARRRRADRAARKEQAQAEKHVERNDLSSPDNPAPPVEPNDEASIGEEHGPSGARVSLR